MAIADTAAATSSRDGQVRSSDGQIDQPVRMPVAMAATGAEPAGRLPELTYRPELTYLSELTASLN